MSEEKEPKKCEEWMVKQIRDEFGPPKVFIVMGATGQGKSALVYSLLGSTTTWIQEKWGSQYNWTSIQSVNKDKIPESDVIAGGATKLPIAYHIIFCGMNLVVIDTPGAGDKDVKPKGLIEMIYEFSRYEDWVCGVIMVAKYEARSSYDQQVITAILNSIMPTTSRYWENVILVHTAWDRVEKRSQGEKWQRSWLQKYNEEANFPALEGKVCTVTCNRTDGETVADLRGLSRVLPRINGRFTMRAPDPDSLWLIFEEAGFKPSLKTFIISYSKSFKAKVKKLATGLVVGTAGAVFTAAAGFLALPALAFSAGLGFATGQRFSKGLIIRI